MIPERLISTSKGYRYVEINKAVSELYPGESRIGDRNNCTVNSLTMAFEISYDRAFAFAQEKWGRERGKGIKSRVIGDSFGWEIGFVKQPLPGMWTERVPPIKVYRQPGGSYINRTMRVSTFMKEFCTGTYYVIVRGHALVIKDGMLIDNMFADSYKKPVLYAWKVLTDLNTTI